MIVWFIPFITPSSTLRPSPVQWPHLFFDSANTHILCCLFCCQTINVMIMMSADKTHSIHVARLHITRQWRAYKVRRWQQHPFPSPKTIRSFQQLYVRYGTFYARRSLLCCSLPNAMWYLFTRATRRNKSKCWRDNKVTQSEKNA